MENTSYYKLAEKLLQVDCYYNLILLGCKCMNYKDTQGYGNCLKRDARFKGSPYSCYVEEPAQCNDKQTNPNELGKFLSVDACKGK